MVQFLTNYSENGQIAVTLQSVGQKMQYVIDDIQAKKSQIVPLAKDMPVHLLEEVKRIAELVWPTKDTFIIKFGFRTVSDELRAFIKDCWREMASKEACLSYMLPKLSS